MLELRTRRRRLSAALALGDAALVIASLALGYTALVALQATSAGAIDVAWKLAVTSWIFVPAHLLVLYVAGFLVPVRTTVRGRYAIQLGLAVVAGAGLASAGHFLLPEGIVGRQPSLFYLPLLFALLLGWRTSVFRAAGRLPARRLAIVGRRGPVEELVAELEREGVPEYVVGPVKLLPEAGTAEVQTSDALAGFETREDLAKLLERAEFDALALDTGALDLETDELRRIVEIDHAGVEVHDVVELHKRVAGCFPSSALDGTSLLRAVTAPRLPYDARLKRLLDVSAAAASSAKSSMFPSPSATATRK